MEVPMEIQILINSIVEEVRQLKHQTAVLEEKLLRCEYPKNSSNSSKPPSQDPYRKKRTENLREKSGKKPGGRLRSQEGAKDFAVIRSVIDTVIKNGQNVSDALNLAACMSEQLQIYIL